MGKSVNLVESGGLLTVFASAARTATVASSTFDNPDRARGLHLIIDVTAVTSTPSTVFTIQGYSGLGDDYYTILASAAIVGTGQTILRVYPALTAAANVVANDVLPPIWRVNAVHGNANSQTYSVQASLLG